MRFFIFIAIILCAFVVTAQPSKLDDILNNDAYLVGMGEDRDYERADKLALADLSRLISVNVESSFLDLQSETNLELSTFTESLIKTYSTAIFDGAERYTEPLSEGGYRVYRYILKSDRNKIFGQREAKIRQYVTLAGRAEDVNDYDIALRDYYWALVLLQSHPDRGGISMEIGGESKLLTVYLPAKVQDLLRDVRIKVENRTSGGDNSALYVNAENSRGKINNLNLKYFDGEEFIPARIKDGKGALHLPNAYLENVNEVRLTIDYVFRDQLGAIPLDEEVKMVSEQIFIPFDNQKTISHGAAPNEPVEPVISRSGNLESDDELVDLTQNLVSAVKTRDFDSVKDYFSEQGYEQFLKIMNYGKVSLYEGQHSVNFVRFGDRILIRSIPLVIQLTDRSKKVIYESICPIVEDGKITWVNFTINDQDAQDAIERGESVGDLEERLLCLTFMEYYKTVFTLKDLGRVSDIFSDDAVIFVGYAKGTAPVPKYLGEAIAKSIDMKDFELIRLSKSEYLERLEQKAFKNPFVNIHFSELEVARRSPTKPIFAIQLHQDYYSTNYADQGYLLIFTDNSDTTQPKIFFRCWQPKKFLNIGDLQFE